MKQKTTWTKKKMQKNVLYQLLNDVKKACKPCITACRDVTGMIMNELSEFME